MNASVIEQLLIRPAYQQERGESVFAYLTRLVDENELSGYRRLTTVLGTSIGRLAREVLGPQHYAGRVHPWADGGSARLCPCCMQSEGAIGLELWDLPLEVSCLTHEVLLIDACPDCDMRISHDRRRLHFCPCGFRFARAPAKAVPPWVAAMRIAFAEAFRDELPLDHRCGLQLRAICVLGWSYEGRCPISEEVLPSGARKSLAELGTWGGVFQRSSTGLSEEFIAELVRAPKPLAEEIMSVLMPFRVLREHAADERATYL